MLEPIFYIFGSLLVVAALLVITLKNSVHSILWLIFCFFNAAALFVFVGAEYIAMTLIIVYVGAVTVLFLFVIMMVDIKLVKVRRGLRTYMPLALFLSGVIFIELQWVFQDSSDYITKTPNLVSAETLSNTEMIGRQLYTKYFFPFQISGIILLVAMVGAIVLTLRGPRVKAVKKQNIYNQVTRRKEDSLELVDAPKGKGVKL